MPTAETPRTPRSTYRLQITAGLRPCRRRRACCPTCRPRRRLGLPVAAARPSRAEPRLRRRRPRPRSTRHAAAPRAWPPRRRRPAGSAWACWSTSCPTTSASPRPAQPVVVGPAEARPRARRTPRPSTSTGRPAAAGSASRSSVTTTGTADGPVGTWSSSGTGELRYHDHRFPIAPGTAQPGDDADAVHDRQHYELVGWRRADDEPQLPALLRRQHPRRHPGRGPRRLRRAHVEIRRWFDEGLVDGLRVDHPDGLRDPGGYLRRPGRDSPAAPTCWSRRSSSPASSCPPTWATAGTTGYDALAPGGPGARPTRQARSRWTRLERRLRGGAGRLGTRWSTAPSARSPTASCAPRCCRIARELLAATGAGGLAGWTRRPSASPTASPSCSPASASTAPTCPPGASTSTRRWPVPARSRPDLDGRRSDAARAAAGRPGEPRRPCASSRPSGMVMAKGVEDSAFYRYSRLDLAQRGGRRPERVRPGPGGVPRPRWRCGRPTGRTR